MLRDYQKRAIEQLYAWFKSNPSGHPCLVLPTGSGKSWVLAALCRDALHNWPETRVLMLTHQKELIEQDAEKMRQLWPNAPMGIYSASIGRRQIDQPITFAGIQSVRHRAKEIGHIDLVVIDECHLCNNAQQGGYRQLLAALEEINPAIRIIGLTATPFRLGQGLLTDGKDALFDDLIYPVSIEELLYKGHLAPLKSKLTDMMLDVSDVHKRGGEYIAKELEAAVDTEDANRSAVMEVVRRGQGYRSWLLFCVGVQHAQHVAEELKKQGVKAACVTGKTPKGERKRILQAFKDGEIQALTNANVLTTGFDHPGTDLVAMLRPTLSPALYVQMAGRGLRPKPHIDHCLVLDFAGNVRRHGPITNVVTPEIAGKGGQAPTKDCPDCGEILAAAARVCPDCGYQFEFQEKEKTPPRLHNDDIMGTKPMEMEVTKWRWQHHVSRTSGREMVKVTYYGALSDRPVTEYLPVMHPGIAGQKARALIQQIAKESGAHQLQSAPDLHAVCDFLNAARHPEMIHYAMDGKFHRVHHRDWHALEVATA